MSPCNASAACKNTDGVPVLDNVAADLVAIWPDLPRPIVTTFPLQFNMASHAKLKLLSSLLAIFLSAVASERITFLAIDILLIIFICLFHID